MIGWTQEKDKIMNIINFQYKNWWPHKLKGLREIETDQAKMDKTRNMR